MARAYRVVFVGLLGFWLSLPVIAHGSSALDAIPYIVAGDLATDDPAEVYSFEAVPSQSADPAFVERAWELDRRLCGDRVVSYVASPLALPGAMLLSRSTETSILVMRVAGAGLLVAGMVGLWARVAHRSDWGPAAMAWAAVGLTPLAAATIDLGQTSPASFASVAIGIAATNGRQRVTRTALWVASCACKAFPMVLGLLLVGRTRTLRVAASMGASLALITLATAGPGVFADFASSSFAFAGATDHIHFNLALRNVVPLPGAASLGLLAAVGMVLVRMLRYITDPDARWAFAAMALLLVRPLVWFHYGWIAVAAVAVALGTGSRERTRNEMLALPLLGAAMIPMASSAVRADTSPVPHVALLVIATGLAFHFARERPPSEARPDATEGPGASGLRFAADDR